MQILGPAQWHMCLYVHAYHLDQDTGCCSVLEISFMLLSWHFLSSPRQPLLWTPHRLELIALEFWSMKWPHISMCPASSVQHILEIQLCSCWYQQFIPFYCCIMTYIFFRWKGVFRLTITAQSFHPLHHFCSQSLHQPLSPTLGEL